MLFELPIESDRVGELDADGRVVRYPAQDVFGDPLGNTVNITMLRLTPKHFAVVPPGRWKEGYEAKIVIAPESIVDIDFDDDAEAEVPAPVEYTGAEQSGDGETETPSDPEAKGDDGETEPEPPKKPRRK